MNPLAISNFASVGDQANSADTTGYGAVNYSYQISKYQITQSQYVEFLNAVARTDTYGLYNTNMSGVRGGITRTLAFGTYTYAVKTNMGNKPINFVNWFSCARYCNWLHNGKPTGAQNASTTENGAYAISGTNATKLSGATYWIPTENEWYKAAYFSMNKSGSPGYWKYATQSDADPKPIYSDSFGDGGAVQLVFTVGNRVMAGNDPSLGRGQYQWYARFGGESQTTNLSDCSPNFANFFCNVFEESSTKSPVLQAINLSTDYNGTYYCDVTYNGQTTRITVGTLNTTVQA
jgi:formylglycine-generating enzyme required for sulfatase activity